MSMRGRRFVEFWRENGASAAVKLIRRKLGDAIAGRAIFSEEDNESNAQAVSQVLASRFKSQQALEVCEVAQPSVRRVSMVTDSIGSESLFGGVGTALLLSAQLANRMNAVLRVVTRNEVPSPANAWQILNAYGIKLHQNIEFAFAPPRSDPTATPSVIDTVPSLSVYPGEIFVTTSWWTTSAALASVPVASIIYLLQEDERMFYAFGEDRVHCERVLRNQDIRFVVNTRLLYDHLMATGLDHLGRNGFWFEPAFPRSLFHPRPRDTGAKKRFFFYARPNNPRNLFHIGLGVIDRAVNEGILDLARWEIFLVGKDIPHVKFGVDYIPQRCEGLGWEAYAELAGTIDLGLSLMYTPHPSYPPFDLAASGAVVVTNSFANKQDLSSYSPNILCVELETEALLGALRTGVAIANDHEIRDRNFAANTLGTDWTSAFVGVLGALAVTR
jgi:O-antigen biosynthesis protein